MLVSLREMDHNELSRLLEVVWAHLSRLSRGEDQQSTYRHPLPYPLSACQFGCRLNGVSLRRKLLVLALGQASEQATQGQGSHGVEALGVLQAHRATFSPRHLRLRFHSRGTQALLVFSNLLASPALEEAF